MSSLLVFLLIVGLFLWLIWYIFFRSVLWVAEPLIEYFEDREAERFSIEDIDKDEYDFFALVMPDWIGRKRDLMSTSGVDKGYKMNDDLFDEFIEYDFTIGVVSIPQNCLKHFCGIGKMNC